MLLGGFQNHAKFKSSVGQTFFEIQGKRQNGGSVDTKEILDS